MAKVSIIVPVYQVKKYLSQCIESILNQTFTDFELILVDDGSTDGSEKMCDQYAKADDRILVIHKKNGGLSEARNRGIDAASGEYLLFVDSDDYIEPNMLECLYRNLLQVHADIAVCNFTYVFDSNKEKNYSTKLKYEIVSANDIYLHRKNEKNYGVWTVAWNKLYKKNIFENLRFRPGKYHEDEFLANELYRKSITLVTVPENLYFYRQRSGSIMRQKDANKLLDIIEAYQDRMLQYMAINQVPDETYKLLIYSLEHLSACKKNQLTSEQKKRFLAEEKVTKEISSSLIGMQLSGAKKFSLLLIKLNPCLIFDIAIRLRKILEKHL